MKKRLISILLALALCVGLLPAMIPTAEAATVASGKCGDNIIWTLNDQGKMTISGSGAMWEDTYNWTNWKGDYSNLVQKLVVGDGVTSVSGFRYFRLLKSVTLPGSLTTIGSYAFEGCTALTSISIPHGVTSIYGEAFHGCTGLKSVTIPNSVTIIEDFSFWECKGLTSLTIPGSVVSLGAFSFASCSALTSVTFCGHAPSGGDNCFSGVNATVSYPDGDSTWTASVRNLLGDYSVAWEPYTEPWIPGQPKSVTDVIGSTAVFSVTAAASSPTYQWYYKTPGGSWAKTTMAGSKTPTLSVKIISARNGYSYKCLITDANGKRIYTNPVTLTVDSRISTQPKDQRGYIGDTAKFTMKASGDGLTYCWQYYTGSAWKNSGLTGHDTPSVSVPVTAARNGQQYRCVITDKQGNKIISSTAKLIVKAKITAQPKNQTVSLGTTVKFTVKATGVGLTYQWYMKTPDGGWSTCSLTGCKTSTLTVTATVARNGYQYKCLITDANGSKTYSNAVKLTVK